MSAFNDISIALNQKLQAYATANSRQVAYENVKFDPTLNTKYLRATVLPATTVQAGMGDDGQEMHEGIFQIDVFAQTNKPKAESLAEADAVANYFQRGLVLTYNSVSVRLKTSSHGAGRVDGGWYIIPVFINYLSFTQAR